MNGSGFAVWVARITGVVFVALGLWAFLDARSFFDSVAVFPPFNAHFLHDVGAFQIGLGAVLLLATVRTDALFVTLAGVAIGNAVHLLSHVMDADLGGKPATDIPFFAVLTVLLAAAAASRRRTVEG